MSGQARPGRKNPHQIYRELGGHPSVSGIIHGVERRHERGEIPFTWTKGLGYDFEEPFNEPPLPGDRWMFNAARDGFLLNPNSRYPNDPETGLPDINWAAQLIPDYDPAHAPASGEGYLLRANFDLGSPHYDPSKPLGPDNHVRTVYDSSLTLSDAEAETVMRLFREERE